MERLTHAVRHTAEDGVLAIQMRRRTKRDEELGTVRVLASIRHAHGSLAIVLETWDDLILKLAAPDGLPSAACAGWVTTLDHEAGDDAVEDDIVVLAGFGERGKVLARLRSIRSRFGNC